MQKIGPCSEENVQLYEVMEFKAFYEEVFAIYEDLATIYEEYKNSIFKEWNIFYIILKNII